MKDFLIRSFCLAAVILILAGYNQVLKDGSKDEEITKLEVQVTKLQQEKEKTVDIKGTYPDGRWEGGAKGFGGMITVLVTVENGTISEIEITSADGEDKAYLSMAEDIIPKIIEAQSADVDTVSGATFSSTGIRDAVSEALKQAEQ
jgi:uncharacterized protein with FMN-binding domain